MSTNTIPILRARYRSVPNPSVREVAEAEQFAADLLNVDVSCIWGADIPMELWWAAVDTAEQTADLDPEHRRDEVLEVIAKYRRALAAVANPDVDARWSELAVSVTWAAWKLPTDNDRQDDLDITMYGGFSATNATPVAIVVGESEVSVAQLRQLRDNCDRALEVAELLGL